MSLLAAFNIEGHANPALPRGQINADTPGVHRRRQGVDNNCIVVAVPSKYLNQSSKFTNLYHFRFSNLISVK